MRDVGLFWGGLVVGVFLSIGTMFLVYAVRFRGKR